MYDEHIYLKKWFDTFVLSAFNFGCILYSFLFRVPYGIDAR